MNYFLHAYEKVFCEDTFVYEGGLFSGGSFGFLFCLLAPAILEALWTPWIVNGLNRLLQIVRICCL